MAVRIMNAADIEVFALNWLFSAVKITADFTRSHFCNNYINITHKDSLLNIFIPYWSELLK